MTKVVNIKSIRGIWPEDHVYIGRAGHGQKGTFGNPVSIGKPCPNCGKTHERQGTLECYHIMLEKRIQTDQVFRDAVRGLAGKTLVCFCKPLPCHGDILAEVAERLSKCQTDS